MNTKWWLALILIFLNILAITISLYFFDEIFLRRFKEFVWVVDILSIPFVVAFFIIE